MDGAALFYLTETELLDELGLRKVGLRKRFVLARLWLAHAHRRSVVVKASAHQKLRGAAVKLSAVSTLSPRPAAAAVAWKTDPLITKGNAPDWQVTEFKKSRNIIGTLVVIIELLISILKLHHLWHFVSLLPLALGGMLGLLSYVRC